MTRVETIVFSSLLIGLISGEQPVSVEIPAVLRAARVDFAIDGKAAGRVDQPPWTALLDFGAPLLPHEVMAAAFDVSGREVGRAVRWVNTPQAPARVEILLERDQHERPVSARLIATSVRGDKPIKRTLKLDGVPLHLSEAGEAVIPTISLAEAHILSGTADFSADALARADLAFGGSVADQAGSRLTAVVVQSTNHSPLSLEALTRALRSSSGPVVPVAIEKGDATILFVRDPINTEAARRLGRPSRDYPLLFDAGDSVGLVWPVSRMLTGGSMRAELFESMGPFGAHDLGYHWLLSRLSRIGRPVPPPYRFADAVAVAGLQACGAGTRRAVVLVQGADRRDASQFSPKIVEGYLDRLGVPLRVWSLLPVSNTRWKEGRSEDVSSYSKLAAAVDRLKEGLSRQRVVWVTGDFAPGQVVLSEGVVGLSAVR